ncbi:hypothetical protein DCAR_0519923 [Daucus carota subsp. sativus]|uniref:Uncharacterized protein n=1 Tax=Daucus carota subsp. sativus TaxID=79200 RepID=A0AAF0X500_DAUCS|nr:hypothetical protein DCAR_0519923 [Daucus carota subsp. sativus]
MKELSLLQLENLDSSSVKGLNQAFLFDFIFYLYFQIQDGVVHIYNLFPVNDAATFFTDLHCILKLITAGNMRKLCHHRLVLLEQPVPRTGSSASIISI